MKLYPKKRLEIFVELPAQDRVITLLKDAGVTGFTITPAHGGLGHSGAWNRDGMIGRVGQMVAIIALTDEKVALTTLEKMQPLLEDHIAVVSMSNVDVVRNTHF